MPHSTATPQSVRVLLATLTDQAGRYRLMETVLQQEKAALIQGNGEQVAAITVDKRRLIREIDELELRVGQELRLAAAELGLDAERAALSEVIAACPPSLGQQLKDLHQAVQHQVRCLQFLSQVNAALLHVAIDWLNQSLDTYAHILRTTLGSREHGALAPAFVNVRI